MNRLIILWIFLSGIMFWACNGDEKDVENSSGKPSVPEEIKSYYPLDLSDWGLDAVLYVPDTSVGLPEIRVNNAGETEIQVGDYFQIAIAQGGDLELKKSDLKEDLLFKCEILEEDSNSILYNAQLPDGSKTFYHFYTIVNLNGVPYELHDIETGDVMPEKAASRMLKAAKFLQAKQPLEQQKKNTK